MLAEESMVDVFVFRVQVVEYNVGVTTVTCCKNDYFEVFAQILENLLGVGTDVYSSLYHLASGESDG